MVGTNRQLLAIVICLYSLDFVFKKKFLIFFSLIALASFIHASASLFIVYYFLNRDFNKGMLFILLVSFIFLGKTEFPTYLFNKFGTYIGEFGSSKTNLYAESIADDLKSANFSVFGLLKRLLLLSIFTYSYNTLSPSFYFYKLFYNGYFLGIAIYFLFSNSFLVLVNRGALYFNIMECCLISCQFVLLKNNVERILIFVVLLFLSFGLLIQSISTYPDLFNPYKSLFYNTSYFRQMY